ncbi:MAG: hypothetical protein PF569_08820 [Candidatus Woesearchaeota archaeon]|jgi:glucan phosphoethanolaminetransferase (alkaline phosphatase superfamily)|nr:hypothetical protein [Candidatus Woesearchaeota archaeon]
MIDGLYFGLGFVVYMIFNILTFKTYSKKEGITHKFALYLIFVYYSILAAYLINTVDSTGENMFEIILQIIIYVLAGFMFIRFYFMDVITENESLD